ncbi:glycosyltransferase [Mangrovivirga sp. M17]|uniref:Glycosyltransferase n=1 Tax=Mangrovivirga halotolerans TaxID=2993936 RepID=A0ABT3RQE8_9BACT|nr:glycosyltransferase [Mangrovivirga halotolerans]MCX2743395.1 glycosyltransferase [Mangrovivirga halotolerans]
MGKPKVLFIGIHRPDRSPSQRFRFEQYLDFLKGEGFDCKQEYLLNQKDDKIFYSDGAVLGKARIVLKSILKLIRLAYFTRYDIVFVQREAIMLGTSFFERRFSKRSKLIFDFDDAIWKHQAGDIKSANKMFYFLKNPNKTKDIIKAADLVIAGNNYLANYARQFNSKVKIIPTTIDTQEYQRIMKKETGKVCIGWSGSFSTIIHFETIIPALVRIKEKYGDKVEFKVIGDPTFSNERLGVKGEPWVKETEVEELSKIDIGIMPLPDDEWTKGKCALKGLQYMALGIPTIMSPVGVNADIIEDGVNGFLAGDEDEWVEKISKLIEDGFLRTEVGENGEIIVKDKFSVESKKNTYKDILSLVMR